MKTKLLELSVQLTEVRMRPKTTVQNSKPIQEAITNAADRIRDTMLHLSKQDIIDLLTVTLTNMYFFFSGQVFRQKEGLPMGSSISGILAILFMDRLETNALPSHLSISPYKRYVDDIYFQTTGEETNFTIQ